MKEIKLTQDEARRLAVASQYEFQKDRFDDGAEGTYQAVRHLGYVQIDTISVIERAHHHTIWNRHHSYRPEHLDTLQEGSRRRIFEYWFHAASYLPMEHYRFCLPRMRRIREKGADWFPRDKRMIRFVLDRIKSEGPLQAKDFDAPQHTSGPWWGWKPAKIALEHLFMEGRLMVTGRNGFQKIYDTAERVLPADTETRIPTPLQMADYLIDTTLGALGLAAAKDILYLKKDRTEKVDAVLQRKLKKKEIVAVRLEGVNDRYYTTPQLLESRAAPTAPFLRFLSPFDNIVIRRQRVADIFDFDYQLECYVPAAKRKRGYFSLPILYRDRLVGTMDAKAHRKTGVFAVRNLHLDHTPEDEDDFRECLRNELQAFADFNNCPDLDADNPHL